MSDLDFEIRIEPFRASDKDEIVSTLEALLESAKRGEIITLAGVSASFPVAPRDDR